MYGRGVVGDVGLRFHCLLLETFCAEGNVVSDSVGSATGCSGIVELPNVISTGKFMHHVGDAGGAMDIIVGMLMADCLKHQAKFSPPVFTGGKSNFGEEHKSELGVVDGDPV